MPSVHPLSSPPTSMAGRFGKCSRALSPAFSKACAGQRRQGQGSRAVMLRCVGHVAFCYRTSFYFVTLYFIILSRISYYPIMNCVLFCRVVSYCITKNLFCIISYHLTSHSSRLDSIIKKCVILFYINLTTLDCICGMTCFVLCRAASHCVLPCCNSQRHS